MVAKAWKSQQKRLNKITETEPGRSLRTACKQTNQIWQKMQNTGSPVSSSELIMADMLKAC